MKAFLLAAGLGQRLRPLTDFRPKPLVPVANRPIIEYTLDFLRSFGCRELIVNLHHLPRSIQAALGDGRAFGVRIEYSPEEPQILGTAGGIKRAEPLLGQETFLVINTDILVGFSLEAALRFHREREALATLVVRGYPEPPRQADLAVDPEGRIRRFLDHGAPSGRPGLSDAGFTGVTLMEPEMLSEMPAGRYCSISEEVYPRLIEAGAPIYGWWMEGSWRDVGTPASYLGANREVLRGAYPAPAGSGGAVSAETSAEGAQGLEGVEIVKPVLLGEGVRIGGGSRLGPDVVVGPGGRIGRNVRLSGSVLWENVELGDGSDARHVIIGSRVRTPKGASLRDRIVVQRNSRLEGFPLTKTGGK